MKRRDFLRLSATGAGLAALAPVAVGCAPEPEATTVFSCGIASGLHSPNAVVLWTRLDPRLTDSTTVDWQLATGPDLGDVVASGTAPAPADHDHCVKILVERLEPGRDYWYQFTVGDVTSVVGRTRTLPGDATSPDSLKLAFASCQMYSAGFYGAWREIAGRTLDAVLFLGDYIYELGLGPLGARWESFVPAKTLDEYRAKYRLYKSDPDLQAAHAAHPWLVIWDDHEVFNDHDASRLAADPVRADAAHQTWFDYQPVMPIDGTRIYRSLRWGDLGEIILTDSRQYRGPHLDSGLLGTFLDAAYAAPDRSILGTPQREWLLDTFDRSQADGIRWKLLANQVLMAPLRYIDLDEPDIRAANPTFPKHAGFYSTLDSWDGFPAERDVVLGHLAGAGITDVAILTGDFHAFFQAALRADFDDANSPLVANEFLTSSISSQPLSLTEDLAAAANNGMLPPPPAFDFVDLVHNGYGLVECTPAAMTVTFMTNTARDDTEPVPAVRWTITSGNPTAVRTPFS